MDTNGRLPQISPETAMRNHAKELIEDYAVARMTARDGLLKPAAAKLDKFIDDHVIVTQAAWGAANDEIKELRTELKAAKEKVTDADIAT